MTYEEKATGDELIGKLHWRCRRGMKELDLLTEGYLERYYPTASAGDRQAFTEVLELQDPLLMSYVVGRQTPENPAMARVIDIMRTLLKA